MTKQELISHVSNFMGTSKVQAELAVNGVVDALKTELIDNRNDVMIPGIGKLKIITRKARIGRNPKSGEVLDVPAHKTVVFKPCKCIKNALN